GLVAGHRCEHLASAWLWLPGGDRSEKRRRLVPRRAGGRPLDGLGARKRHRAIVQPCREARLDDDGGERTAVRLELGDERPHEVLFTEHRGHLDAREPDARIIRRDARRELEPTTPLGHVERLAQELPDELVRGGVAWVTP